MNDHGPEELASATDGLKPCCLERVAHFGVGEIAPCARVFFQLFLRIEKPGREGVHA